jgi:hypothetical protein
VYWQRVCELREEAGSSREVGMERERDGDAETERHTDRQPDRQADRQRDTDRQIDRHRLHEPCPCARARSLALSRG